jgi:hypothetical protein
MVPPATKKVNQIQETARGMQPTGGAFTIKTMRNEK